MNSLFPGQFSKITRRQTIKLLGAVPAFVVSSLHLPGLIAEQISELEFESPDARLVSSFRWAKHQALAYVFDGDPVGPWYEAALPGRHAFCMRDTAHQAAGAQALGLAKYNHNMLRKFAENISASRDWCSYWEIDSLNRPAPVDYVSDTQFWYNLPANYDILDACYRMYLWTGDQSFIEDPVFLNFYNHTIIDYTNRWDLAPDRIMQRTSNIQEPPFFRGDPTYEESSRDNLVGIDLLATQYAAFRAYADIQWIREERQSAKSAQRTALEIKNLINGAWWNSADRYFYAFYNKQHQFVGQAGADLLYRDAAERGQKTQSAIETLLATMKSQPADAVEARSHYAEILYRYGSPEAAYKQMTALTQSNQQRREYPEVSYSVIGALVMGLMGICVEPIFPFEHSNASNALRFAIVTLPRLTSSSPAAELHHLPAQNTSISVRHQGNQSTTLTNHGRSAVQWKASFHGRCEAIHIGRKPLRPRISTSNAGRVLSSALVEVSPGQTIHAEARS